MWTNEECLAELENLSIDDVKTLVPRLTKQLHIEALVHGNLYKEVRYRAARDTNGLLSFIS
jgi:insulysin